jgi:hypothetical protein
MWLAVVVQVAIPMFLIGAVVISRQPNRFRWLVTFITFGMVIAYLLLSARWDISSLYLRVAIPVAFIAANFIGYQRIRESDTAGKLQAAVYWTTTLGVIVLMSGFLWFSIRGNLMPDGAVDLTSPLEGTNVVLNGGSSPFTNAHFRVRPQDFALDIVGVNAIGSRASLFGSHGDLGSYVIYGAPIFSPCDGRISAVVNTLPDHSPPDGDTENPAGNHVLIECKDIEVLLAHMQQQSVTVTVGELVTTGALLGKVGNSGNTTEPHLHIHAERGGEPGVILDGEAVPITIAGRFLVRNSIFRVDR